jgi:hypothetical protein
MRIPKNCDIQLDTSSDVVELKITAAITTKAQANELAAAIKQLSTVLEGERRQRRKAAPAQTNPPPAQAA